MPAARPPIKAHPSKPFYTFGDAARGKQLVLLRCNLCNRGVTLLAEDVIKIIDPKSPTHLPPLPCSKCGSSEYVDCRIERQRETDRGLLHVRRLVGFRQVPIWRDKLLGE